MHDLTVTGGLVVTATNRFHAHVVVDDGRISALVDASESAPPAARTVDATGRVHGVTGLRVLDASIAPTVPHTNTHLLVTAMAEHAAARWDAITIDN